MLRITVARIALGLLLGSLSLFAWSNTPAEPCQEELLPSLVGFDQATYQKSYYAWLEHAKTEQPWEEEKVFEILKASPGPESYLALADALVPSYEWSFWKQITHLSQFGLRVEFRKVKGSEITTWHSFSGRALVIEWPEGGIPALGQGLRHLRLVSQAVSNFYALSVARKGEWFSLPFSKNTRSYASRVAQAYTTSELHFYAITLGLKRAFPQYESEFPAEEDGLTNNPPSATHWKRILGLLFHSNYKYYLKHVFNAKDFASFERIVSEVEDHHKNPFEVEVAYKKEIITPRILAHAQLAQKHRTWRPVVYSLLAALTMTGLYVYDRMHPPLPDPMGSLTVATFDPNYIDQLIRNKQGLLSNEEIQTLQKCIHEWRSTQNTVKRAVLENQIGDIFEKLKKRELEREKKQKTEEAPTPPKPAELGPAFNRR
jgi:hypothetical protein